MKQIGPVIRENRIKKNMTQQALADQLSVTKQAISKWENNRGLPDITIIEPLALCLDIPIDLLIGTNLNKKKKRTFLLLIYLFLLSITIYVSLFFIKEMKKIQFVQQIEETVGFDLPRADSYQIFDFSQLIIFGNQISVEQMSYVIFKDNKQLTDFEDSLQSHQLFQMIDANLTYPLVPDDITSYLTSGDYYLINENCIEMVCHLTLYIYQMEHHRLLIFNYVL